MGVVCDLLTEVAKCLKLETEFESYIITISDFRTILSVCAVDTADLWPLVQPSIASAALKRLQTSCTREFKAMLTDSDAGKEVVASVGILVQRGAKDEVGDERLKSAKNSSVHGSMPFVEKEVLEDDMCWTVRNCATFGSAKVVGVV